MASSSENDSEILLGNKQLLAVFAVVALLLAVAFTGGYMLGKSAANKKAASPANDVATDSGVTKTVKPDDTPRSQANPPPLEDPTPEPLPIKKQAGTTRDTTAEAVLGSRAKPAADAPSPKVGQTFVQVAALTRTQAEATADVLRKQKFHARIAPKPGSASIFRVLVGPVTDAGELSATRDALRKIGFRDVIVQRYQ